jgi:elongation factor 1 alpha-like protein
MRRFRPKLSRCRGTPCSKGVESRVALGRLEQLASLPLLEEARSGGKTKISMVVIGHVDAGKSTITGHLLFKLG